MKFPPGYVPGSGVHKASGFGGFGERLLRKQGWEKGEGLGKNKTGVAEAIQVRKKEDTAGVRLLQVLLSFVSHLCCTVCAATWCALTPVLLCGVF